MAAVTKAALRRELQAKLAEMLATAREAHAAAVEGATHGEARAENDKDTRGLEQSYLARGQAARVAELETAQVLVARLPVTAWPDDAPIAVGALVTVTEGDATARYLLAAGGGGLRLDGGRVQVVTPTSPIGGALAGKRVGDEATLRGPGGTARELTIDDVA